MRVQGLLAGLVLVVLPITATAQGMGYLPNGDPYAYGALPGYHLNGLGYTLGWNDIYDARPYGTGWYWPNVHWPSRDWHYTYRAGPNAYRVFYPSLQYPREHSYLIQTLVGPNLGDDSCIQIQVQVPTDDSELFVQGVRMKQQGLTRRVASPPLAAGESYVYKITVRWNENGQQREQTKKLPVRLGEATQVSYEVR